MEALTGKRVKGTEIEERFSAEAWKKWGSDVLPEATYEVRVDERQITLARLFETHGEADLALVHTPWVAVTTRTTHGDFASALRWRVVDGAVDGVARSLGLADDAVDDYEAQLLHRNAIAIVHGGLARQDPRGRDRGLDADGAEGRRDERALSAWMRSQGRDAGASLFEKDRPGIKLWGQMREIVILSIQRTVSLVVYRRDHRH